MSSKFDKIFIYDPNVPGCLRWKVDVMCGHNHTQYKVRKGEVAGGPGHGRYFTVRHNRKPHYNHRIIWELFYGQIDEGFVVDHIDHNPHNNLVSNLRLVSHAVNCRNSKISTKNKSGVTGVSFQTREQAWRASWKDGDKHKSKSFRISMYGDEAFRQACEYRAKMIAELNEQGANYTDRHGT